MQIKRYEQQYRNQIIALILYIQNYENKVDLSLEEQPDMADIAKYYQQNGGEFWVAVSEEGDVVGTIGLMKKEQHFGVLKKFFVKKEFRGKGIADALFSCLIKKAEEFKMKTIVLDTPSACNRAHGFYKKRGFVQITKEQLTIHYDYPDRDSLLFIKQL